MSKIYEVGVIGAGVAGAFAALKVAESFKSKVIVFDLGRPPGKRRRQLEGWLGCFPFGDGKIYINDLDRLSHIVDGRSLKSANKWVHDSLSNAGPMKIVTPKSPSVTALKRAKSLNFDLSIHDYIQWKPDSVHKLSRYISDKLDDSTVELSFDNEVHTVKKKNGIFILETDDGTYKCKKLLMCVGRSGWRWVNDLYKSMGLSVEDNKAQFGIRIECPSQHIKEFNKSHCSFTREDLEIGPLSWGGTVIPEDHADLVISAYRSNEDRWKTDKVSFSLIGKRDFPNKGVYETERLGKLAFLLFNDRIGKEKVRRIVKGDSSISLLPEYAWLSDTIKELETMFPSIMKSNFHSPSIKPMAGKINLSKSLESEVDGFYVAGESAGFEGIFAAAVSGTMAIEGALK